MIEVQYHTEYFKLSWTILSHWKSSSVTSIIQSWHNQKHQLTRPQCYTCWKLGSKLQCEYTYTFTADCLWKAQLTPANCVAQCPTCVKLHPPKQCRQNFKKIIEWRRWGTVMATKLHSISCQYISKNCFLCLYVVHIRALMSLFYVQIWLIN